MNFYQRLNLLWSGGDRFECGHRDKDCRSLIGWMVRALRLDGTCFAARMTKYTCQGASISPALHIGEFPAGTKSLAIILHDPDAGRPGGFTHWVVFNIDPTADIPEGYKGGVQALNGAAKAGYVGPCPPSGVHHYHFMVYALDTRLELSAQSGKAELEKVMQGHILAQGDLVGLYSKTK